MSSKRTIRTSGASNSACRRAVRTSGASNSACRRAVRTSGASNSARRRAVRTAALALVATLSIGGWAQAASLGQTSDFLTPSVLSGPEGVAAGPDGNIWFTEFLADKIGELDPATHAIVEFTVPTAGAGPLGITAGPDGNLWFTEWAAGKVGEINPSTHAITEYAVPTPDSEPVDIVTGPDGNLWFTESLAGKVAEISPTTHVVSEFPTGVPLSGPVGIAVGSDGNLWFTDKSAGKVGEISPITHALREFTVPTPLSQPNGIASGPLGSLWFTESGTGKIGVFAPADPPAISEIALPNALSLPLAITTGPDGNMWFTEGGISRIGQIDPVTHTLLAGFATPTGASDPVGLAVGADGNVWFAEYLAGKLGVIGAGASAASTAAPSILGTPQPGSTVTCGGATWATWADLQPSLSAESFDGVRWLLAGAAIAGADSPTYTPTAAEVGQQLSCQATVTYPLTSATALATSAGVDVSPQLAASLARTSLSGAKASLRISCTGAPGQACTGPITISSRVKGRQETVATGSYSLQAGQTSIVAVKLNRTGAGLLAARYRLTATLAVGGTTPLKTSVTFSYPVVSPKISAGWKPGAGATVATSLTISRIPAGGSVQAICHGGGCPFRTRRVRAEHGRASLSASFADRSLSVGATLELIVSAPAEVASVTRFTIVKDERPALAKLCLAPGASKPSRCA